MKKSIILLLAVAALNAGCATKNYGRQGELTDYEVATLNCREIELETAKVHGYITRVEKESGFDGRSILSFLGDFGVGNVIEKGAAMDSAHKRLEQLQMARLKAGCSREIRERAVGATPRP